MVAPTETRYGLLVRADDSDALDRLYLVKGRPQSMPTAIFIRDLADLPRFALTSSAIQTVAARFLPGPLTLVLLAAANLPQRVVSEGKVGIRISPAPFIRDLLEQIDFPVTATSANPSGKDDCYTVEEIAHHFGGRVDLYIDAGILDNMTSTVVDLTGEDPVILREGAITESAIKRALKSQLI